MGADQTLPTLAAYAYTHAKGPARSEVLIEEKSGNDLRDFQVKVVLDETWNGWGLVQPDGSDIFFLDENGDPLYFWIELFDPDNKKGVIWVKIPSIPALGTVKAYMYFGGANPYAGYRDPERTFDFFDHFDKDVLDTNKWTLVNGTISVSNSVLEVSGDGTRVRSVPTFGGDYIIEMLVDPEADGAFIGWDADTNVDVNPGGTWSGNAYLTRVRETATLGIMKMVDGQGTWVDEGTLYFPAGFAVLKIVHGSDGLRAVYVDDELSASITDTTFTSGHIHIETEEVGVSGTPYIAIDWVRVRKYANPEPAVTVGQPVILVKGLDLM